MLPALLQSLKGWGVSLSVLRPYATHCIKLLSFKDDAQEHEFTEDKQTKDIDY